MKKNHLKFLLKLSVSLILMALLIWKARLDQVLSAFGQIDAVWFSIATLLFFFQQLVVAYCWKIVLDARVSQVGLWKVLQVHFIGIFFGVLLPTSIGMDVVRAFSLSRHLSRKMDAMSSLFYVRVIGYLVFFFIALFFATVVAFRSGNFVFALGISITTFVFCLLIWLSLHPSLHTLIEKIMARFRLSRFLGKLTEFREDTLELMSNWGVLSRIIAYSFFFQLFGIYIVYLVGHSVGIDLGLIYYFIYVPIIMAITILPLSLAGIGIREGAFVFFFAPLGVPEAKSLTLSLLLFVQMLILALAGGLVYLFSGIRKPNTIQQDVL